MAYESLRAIDDADAAKKLMDYAHSVGGAVNLADALTQDPEDKP